MAVVAAGAPNYKAPIACPSLRTRANLAWLALLLRLELRTYVESICLRMAPTRRDAALRVSSLSWFNTFRANRIGLLRRVVTLPFRRSYQNTWLCFQRRGVILEWHGSELSFSGFEGILFLSASSEPNSAGSSLYSDMKMTVARTALCFWQTTTST